MLRPIASNEVGVLVRATVAVSAAFNRALGLTGQAAPPTDEPPETVVQVREELHNGASACCTAALRVQVLAWWPALEAF
jgi:hypothetical protein